MDTLEYVSGEAELLDEISDLWARLNEHHSHVCPRFAGVFLARTFDDRKKDLIAKSHAGKLKVDVARTRDTMEIVGYCVSTVDSHGNGEVDSIFVDERYRRRAVASRFMTSAMAWMDDLGVTVRRINVAFGNEDALEFYERFGFHARSMVLDRVPRGESP